MFLGRFALSHTFYFSNLLLGIFSELSSESVKEQITRVLLERIMVNKPHPWVSLRICSVCVFVCVLRTLYRVEKQRKAPPLLSVIK
jgi:hypothetical protein